jgi:hypothetical protein
MSSQVPGNESFSRDTRSNAKPEPDSAFVNLIIKTSLEDGDRHTNVITREEDSRGRIALPGTRSNRITLPCAGSAFEIQRASFPLRTKLQRRQ